MLLKQKEIPDIILYNAVVHSINENDDIFQAVAVCGNRIIAVGNSEDVCALADSHTKRIDCRGKSLIPGIHDGHNHIWEAGLMYDGIVVFGITTVADLQRKIADRLSGMKKGQWLQGGSYIESQFEENRAPNRYDLDAASPENPVVIERIFGASSVNSLALAAAGITKDTPDPEKGKIERDPKTGEPTGVLHGNAVLLVRAVMPGPFGSDEFGAGRGEPSTGILEKSISLALERYKTYGITSVSEPGVSAAVCKAYHNLKKQGKLSCRIDLMPNWYGFTLMQDEAALSTLIDHYHFSSGYGDEWIRYTSLKMAVDGGLTSGTALKSWPYKGESGLRKLNLRLDLDKLDGYIKTAHNSGWDVGIHVMGDVAIEKAVDAMYKAIKANPRPHRHHIIHAYYPTAETLSKMGEVGIMASVQGSFIYGEADGYDAILTPEKQEEFLPLKSYLNAGVICSLSTDMPCADVNPFWSMYSAVTRKGMRGHCLGEKEKITLTQALRMLTLNGAIQNREEHYKGSIEPGKVADMVLLDRNLLTIDDESIKEIKVEKTMLDGTFIYER